MLDEAGAAGYVVIGDRDELQRVKGGKVLGLFNMGNMSYEIDRAPTLEPSLAEMAAKTLQVLGKSPGGFFAMIEGGRIDHAAHRNDVAGAIREILAFDEAVGVALDFQQKQPEALLIVTADHETGGMAVIGQSQEGEENTGTDLAPIQMARMSLELLVQELGKSPTPEKIRGSVKRNLGIEFTEEEAKPVAGDSTRKTDPATSGDATLDALALALRPYLRVGFASRAHTTSPLLAFGVGPGADELVGFRHRTAPFQIMKGALR